MLHLLGPPYPMTTTEPILTQRLALSTAAGLGAPSCSGCLAAFSTVLVMARLTGVVELLDGAGVLERVGGAERLCCIWALTR